MENISFEARFFSHDMQQKAAALLPQAAQALLALQDKTCNGREWTGWYNWPRQHGFALANEVRQFVSRLDAFYDLVVVVGIGGSYLGTRAVSDALSHQYGLGLGRQGAHARRPMLVYAGHNLSEQGLVELLDLLEERQPVINVISKSGTTTEPAVAFRVLRGYMEKRFGKAEAARRIIATTDSRKGALRQLAEENGYQTFAVPDDVGGRYSVLTAVGLVPLALGGFDIDALLAGADGLFASLAGVGGSGEHPVLQYAAYRNAAYDAGKLIELLSYGEPKLFHVAEWWKQLLGESEGKEGKGIFPASIAYTTDLHSLGQYVQDGRRDMIETFLITAEGAMPGQAPIERRLRVPRAADNLDELGYLENRFIAEINEAAMQGSKVAHYDGGVPCMEVRMPAVSEASLGALFAFFETACAVSGAMLGVNPFDQPGVEAYKKNLFGLLGKPGFEALGAELRRRL